MTIKDIFDSDLSGSKQEIKGWVKSHQIHLNISFININDGSTIKNLQLVCKKSIDPISIGSAITVSGIVKRSKNSNQKYELEILEIQQITKSEDFPIQKKEHTFEFLRENAHLRHRTTCFQAINNIKNTIFQSIHSFFYKNGFTWIQAPIITSNNCEGGANVFKIESSQEFFKKNALLSVSGQLHAEAIALGMTKVYAFGPTFRSEKSNSSSHLSEFWMIEPEIAFCNLEKLMNIIEDFIKHIAKQVLKNNIEDLDFLSTKIENNENIKENIEKISTNKFDKLEYVEAINLLKDNGFQVEFGDDLNSGMERYITEKLKGPVFVFNYPKEIKAFYMKENFQNPKVVNSTDLLIPNVGELIGGSERENDFKKISEKIQNTKELDWYINLRKYGYASSAGFGCGFERLVMCFTGVKNIKDVINYPRSWGQLNY